MYLLLYIPLIWFTLNVSQDNRLPMWNYSMEDKVKKECYWQHPPRPQDLFTLRHMACII